MYNWIDSNTRDRDWTGFRRSVVVSFFFREIWGNSRNPIKANWSKQIQVLSCIISWPVFLSFSCQAGQLTDWTKKGQLRPKIRQCTVVCCLLNFRCCCSILFVKISFFSFLRQVPRIKHIFFFSISYNTSNQHFNSRPRHLISGSSMLHNGTDGCFIFFFQFLLLLLFRSGRLDQHVSKFDITFTLDFLFIFFQVSNKVSAVFHVSAIHFVLKKHLI